MSKVSISEASRIAGKSRQTIHRHIKAGKLSVDVGADGRPEIDTSELVRVYGVLQPTDKDTSRPDETEVLHREIEMLHREMSHLRERLEETRRDKDRLLGIVENQQRLLTSGNPESRKSLLDRLLRR